jgi:hypothetical protein
LGLHLGLHGIPFLPVAIRLLCRGARWRGGALVGQVSIHLTVPVDLPWCGQIVSPDSVLALILLFIFYLYILKKEISQEKSFIKL